MAIQKTDKIWHNGEFINWDDATVHVMSHVVNYGSSVFEGIRCYALPSGPAIFRATEHMQRLIDSARIYRIDIPFTRDQIVRAMLELVRHNGVWPCYIRPIVLRGYGDAGVTPSTAPSKSTSRIIPGENIWGRTPVRGWTFAFLPGRGSRPTLCRRWLRRARTI